MSNKSLLFSLALVAVSCAPGLSAGPAAPSVMEVPLLAADPAPAEAAPDLALATIPVPQTAPDSSMPEACTHSRGFSQNWRVPLGPAPVYNPPGQKRVGLQAGHWLNEERPDELSRLSPGSSGGGLQEWQVNLDIVQRTARLLEAEGVAVDILPTTVPPGYKAHAFVSIHADGDVAGRLTGFKIARPDFSAIPQTDDRLVSTLNEAYAPITGLRRVDDQISIRMRYYYAFNSRRYCHSVAPGVPQAIVETGFLTSPSDRTLLVGNPEVIARGIARGILAFLNS